MFRVVLNGLGKYILQERDSMQVEWEDMATHGPITGQLLYKNDSLESCLKRKNEIIKARTLARLKTMLSSTVQVVWKEESGS